MSAEWPVYKVADLEESEKLLVQDGNHGEYRPRKDEFVGNGTAFIRAADLGCGAVKFDSAEKINDVAFKRIRKGIGKDLDTILSTKGTVGKIAFVPEGSHHFVCSPQTSFWRSIDHDFLDPKFLYYELQSSHFLNQTSSRKGETDMADYLSLTNQRGLNIRVPDITVQREAAKILGLFDDKIELNRKINQTLEQIAQTIFKSWFVDFEPVKAKIEAKAAGRDPERAAMCAISGKLEPELDQLPPEQYHQLAVTAALFPEELVESELGLIPEGWEEVPLYDTANYVNGSAFKSEDFSEDDSGVPIVKIAELKQGITGQTKFTTKKFQSKYAIKSGDMLYSWSGSPETSLEVFKWFGGCGWLNQHIFKLNFSSTEQRYFTYYLLKHLKPLLVQTAMDKQTTGLGHVTVADMKRIKVAYPETKVLEAFSDAVGSFYEQDSKMCEQISTLAALRDNLLLKLLSGELSVGECECRA